MANLLTRPRLIRLTLSILVPPVMMAISYVLINTWHGSFQIGLAIGWLTLTQAFRIASIQLLAYSLLMEFFVIPKLKNIHTVALISGLLILLIIASAFLASFGLTLTPFENDYLTPVLGFVIGSLLGYSLKLSTQMKR